MKKVAVIVAGGAGLRMGGELPKQFLLLNGKPILYYTLATFLQAYADMRVVLVLPEAYTALGTEIVDGYFDNERVRVVVGGQTRFESVRNGLRTIEEEAIVFVHDAVRCLLTTDLIKRCYEMALQTGSAVPVVACTDSVRVLSGDGSDTIDRDKVVLVQTPQVFHSKILLPAFEIDFKEKFTDEASVAEAFGIKVSLVNGEKNNIKITHPLDMVFAEAVMQVNR